MASLGQFPSGILDKIATVSSVISIEVPDDAIVERIVGRRMDPEDWRYISRHIQTRSC